MSAADGAAPLEVDVQTVANMLKAGDKFLLLDCREPDEYNLVHIEPAQLLPMSQLAGRLAELADHRDTPLVVHCHHGGRSLKVAKWLREQGFPQAQSMTGGIDAWSLHIDASKPRY